MDSTPEAQKRFTVAADVTRDAEIRRLIERVREEFGALDVLVSNARPEMAAFYQPPLSLTASASTSRPS